MKHLNNFPHTPNTTNSHYHTIFILLSFLPFAAFGNGLNFSFANAKDTIIGIDTFRFVDVMVATQAATPVKMGFGEIYFEYNVGAFGTHVGSNPATTIVYNNSNYLLGTIGPNGFFNNYYYITTGSDIIFTPNRFKVSWEQYIAEDCLQEHLTQTPRKLFTIRLKYILGGTKIIPDICFSKDPQYIDKVYSSCGPFSGMSCTPGNIVADCQNYLGSPFIDNNYTCDISTSLDTPLSFSSAVFQTRQTTI